VQLENFDNMRILEKTERRLGEKLLLKGDRCAGPKCALTRRAYPPGVHGAKKTRRRKESSEYGALLKEKQKVRFLYGLDDNDIKRYNEKAALTGTVYATSFLKALECRLDNVVFRLGLAPSRRSAHQLVSHGQVAVNGKRIDVSSYQVKRGDRITLREKILSALLFAHLESRLKRHQPPRWLALDKKTKEGRVESFPQQDDFEVGLDITKIKEFYSR